MTRLTAGANVADIYPAWSPDGRQIAFASNRGANTDVYLRRASSPATETLLLKSDYDKAPNDWSPDGRFLLYEDKAEGRRACGPFR